MKEINVNSGFVAMNQTIQPYLPKLISYSPLKKQPATVTLIVKET